MIRVIISALLIYLWPSLAWGAVNDLLWSSTTEQSGRFVQEKHLAALNKPFVTRGTYLYRKSSGLDWRTVYPITNELNISVDGVVEVQSDGGRKTLTTDTRFSELLLAIFSGDQQKLQQQFSIEHTEHKLKLRPRVAQVSDIIREISVHIENHSIKEITLYEPGGNSTHISLLAEENVNDMR